MFVPQRKKYECWTLPNGVSKNHVGTVMRILFFLAFLTNIVLAFGALPWLPNPMAVPKE